MTHVHRQHHHYHHHHHHRYHVPANTLHLIFMHLIIFTTVARADNTVDHLQHHDSPHQDFPSVYYQRLKRDVTTRTVTVPTKFLENIGYDLDLLDLTTESPGRTYNVTGSSADVPNMFLITDDDKLRLNPALSSSQRKKFDYETFPTFEIYVDAIKNGTSDDVEQLTIQLTLADVNDEPPRFQGEPVPYKAQLPSSPSFGAFLYRLSAVDDDSDSELVMWIVAVEPVEYFQRFRLEQFDSEGTVEGIIIIQGEEEFPPALESITIYVSVRDDNAEGNQVAQTEIQAFVGLVNPQFYLERYTGFIKESIQSTDSNIVMTQDDKPLVIRVNNFQPSTQISWKLKDSSGNESTVFQLRDDGQVVNIKVVDFEATEFINLTVQAIQTTDQLSSTVELGISVLDENDNAPQFTRDQFRNTVPEDSSLNLTILNITATDIDANVNGELMYKLRDNDWFFIETVKEDDQYVGKLKVKRELDYDDMESQVLIFPVVVEDNGNPSLSATSTIVISTTNVNDNPPTIDNSTDELRLIETAKQGFVLTVIQASDVDGDNVKFSFADGLTYEIFEIDQNTGQIKLNSDVDAENDYHLTIVATDDGSCCGEKIRHSSSAEFTINIQDVNSNKPDFENCSAYDSSVTIQEGADQGVEVTTVTATDDDRGINGEIIYLFNSPGTIPFSINKDTGLITVNGEISRNKDETVQKFIQVTVIGRNPGIKPLIEGWCTFRIAIEYINKYAPKFSQTEYSSQISLTSTSPQVVRQIIATDRDVGDDARISYKIIPSGVFTINETTGVVTFEGGLNKTIELYELTINATDHGTYPMQRFETTKLKIKIIKEPKTSPSWIDPPNPKEIFVNETDPIGTEITRIRCASNIEGNDEVDFRVFDNEDSIAHSSKTFRVRVKIEDPNMMLLETQENLDYNKKKEYSISVVCQNSIAAGSIPTSLTLKIKVVDQNNKSPRFLGLSGTDGRYEGSVPENPEEGVTVAEVQADDEDLTPAFRTVTFSVEAKYKDTFKVESSGINRARIITTEKATLDRESITEIIVKITAKDNAPSYDGSSEHNTAQAYIRVTITDVNDNAPQFNKTFFESTVSETANINDIVLSVKAIDNDTVDENLNYMFVKGNENNAFSVVSGSGDIKVARKLDYENPSNPKVYHLTLQATDQGGIHSSTTIVNITVLDENDNSPLFVEETYTLGNNLTDESYTEANSFLLGQVTATDKDQGRLQTDIRYSLLDDSNLFRIDRVSGKILLIGKFDHNHRTPYSIFTVQAEDERENPRTNYAYVRVQPESINYFRPVFDNRILFASVKELSPKGTTVLKVVARDKDEDCDVVFKLSTDQPSPKESNFFQIDTSGVLKTNVERNVLDRDDYDKLFVSVIATDQGMPPKSTTATVTIVVKDINNKTPYFLQTDYNIHVPEHHVGMIDGQHIQANDKDIDPINKNLIFRIDDDDGQQKFNVLSDGFISVKSEDSLDYEKGPQKLDFKLIVSDGKFENYTQINIFVMDINDNPPKFDVDLINITLLENVTLGSHVTQVNATDADEGNNGEIIYSIFRDSDLRHEFFIDPQTGEITTKHFLDREKEAVIELIVIATDKGANPLTGTATINIILTDVNDNAPKFRDDYLPKVEENQPNDNTQVVEIFAYDPDTLQYGPPFGFKLLDGCTTPACQNFQLQMIKTGNNSAIIQTSTTFDREKQKQYYLPIVMWDMWGKSESDSESRTTTNTLTIIIGDENDNKHFPGHQDILVYNYKGTKGPIEVGRVYALDEDDWDLPDKTFTSLSPETMTHYFSVAEDTGMITMLESTPPNALQSLPTYKFEVKVHDKKFGNTETCTVSVRVDDLSEQAVYKAGTMRISGVNAEDFIIKQENGKSKSDLFKEKLSEILGYDDTSHIEIVTLLDGKDGLDIRFSAHGSPYLNPAQVESAVMLHQANIEKSLDIKIQMLPVNLCMDEIYDEGCSMVLEITDEANMVNANGTSYVGVKAIMKATSGCHDCSFPDPERCTGDYCYNGGSCEQDDWGKIICNCRPGFDGPRCQQRSHHFNGSSLAFYKSFSVCANGRTMVDFITLNENGFIMYSGSTEDQKDVFILELKSGYIQLRINLGAGELLLSLDGLDTSGVSKMGKLNDGKWHHIDIDKNDHFVQLTVDKCHSADVSPDGKIMDWSPCRAAGSVPYPYILLNVAGFLQMGGHYNKGKIEGGFFGCVKNLVHNTKLYDLSFKDMPSWNSGQANCPREHKICGTGKETAICGTNADCKSQWEPKEEVVQCTCHPGWKGDKCQEETPIKDFGSRSYFKWTLTTQSINNAERSQDISLMFRTRQQAGTLFTTTNENFDSISIQLDDGLLVLRYNMGDGEKTIKLHNAHANSGQWHTLKVERYGNEFTISMDNGEGRNYKYDIGQEESMVLFKAKGYISAGARVYSDHQLSEDLVNTCIKDVRFNDEWLPMDKKDNPADPSFLQLDEIMKVVDNCNREDCVPDKCGPEKICYPLWELEECRCPISSNDINGKCEVDCVSMVCYNGGKCVMVGNISTCVCIGNWKGEHCNVLPITEGNDDDPLLSGGELAGIIIAIIILLALIVCIILFLITRGRKNLDNDKLVYSLGPDEDFIRENIMYYDEEGAGEKDNDGYSLADLQVPTSSLTPHTIINPVALSRESALVTSSVPSRLPQKTNLGKYLDDQLADDPDGGHDKDSLRHYADEGSSGLAGSVSSLSSISGSDSSQDYDYLSGWGPKFSRLANMYGAGSEFPQQQ